MLEGIVLSLSGLKWVSAETPQAAVSDINKRRFGIAGLVPIVIPLAHRTYNDIIREASCAHIVPYFRDAFFFAGAFFGAGFADAVFFATLLTALVGGFFIVFFFAVLFETEIFATSIPQQ
jgi:hypothetical protein